jgi:geranylgeranyl pyrophosphate synthase
MEKPVKVLSIFEKYTSLVDVEIKSLISNQDDLLMYDMMSYFFGYLDEDLNAASGYGGKRFRPGIALLCGEFFERKQETLGAAAAIEIFHNFTLIHDDIEDNDPIRRGRPTVWKKWGLKHGINTGDTQLILAYNELAKHYSNDPEILLKLISFLSEVYQGVAEGQFLDFTLAEKNLSDKFVTEENYLEMIKRKSAILVAASAKVAGIIAGLPEQDLNNLWLYGLNLGYAYQLNDDLVSIWGRAVDTGKVVAKDIEEHKKTLPIIYLYSQLEGTDKSRFASIYNKTEELNQNEISEIKSLLNEKDAGDYVWEKIKEHLLKSEKAIELLPISDDQKNILLSINHALVPDTKWWAR